MVTPENRKRIDVLLKRVEDYIRALPQKELVTEPQDLTILIAKILTAEELLFLSGQGDEMNVSERNDIMKQVFQRTGRYIIQDYETDFKGEKHRTFNLYIAEQV